MTRAELMRHALTQALRRVHIGPKKLKLDEETRWQIAGKAVAELRRFTPRDRAARRGLLDAAKDLLFVATSRERSRQTIADTVGVAVQKTLVDSPYGRAEHEGNRIRARSHLSQTRSPYLEGRDRELPVLSGLVLFPARGIAQIGDFRSEGEARP
jgi:hypothetical protein